MNKQTLKLGARILENLPTMSPEVMQGWIENPHALKKFLSGLAPAMTRLTTLTPDMVSGNAINPQDFFRSREGLSILPRFDNSILLNAMKKTVQVNKETIGYADLVQLANHTEIGTELPGDHIFMEVDTFLAYLAVLIASQWGGTSGMLLNNGRSNIFYVKVNEEVFAVYVHWSRDDQQWFCNANHLHDGRWGAGCRVFSATAF